MPGILASRAPGNTPSAGLQAELEAGAYHPFGDDDGLTGFLRRLTGLLGPQARFLDYEEGLATRRAPGCRPADSSPSDIPTIERDACLLLRDRPSGLPAAFARVLADLEDADGVPPGLSRVVGVHLKASSSHDTAALGNEPWDSATALGGPADVLLSKPANMEQIQIQRMLAEREDVIVQGPPGTGKSHTIANLVGHLVARGQRVLVTSHTTKALRVLRGYIIEDLLSEALRA